jgi:hypothetical protein
VGTKKNELQQVWMAIFQNQLILRSCSSYLIFGLKNNPLKGRDYLTIVIRDSKEVVICEVSKNGEADGVWTTTPSIILVAKEYIKHDIWGNILIENIGKEKFNTMCDSNEMLPYLIQNR